MSSLNHPVFCVYATYGICNVDDTLDIIVAVVFIIDDDDDIILIKLEIFFSIFPRMKYRLTDKSVCVNDA